MGIARALVEDGAQAEALGGVVGGTLEPAIVEGQRLGLAEFEEELAVIRTLERIGNDGLDALAVETGAGEEELVGLAEVGHGVASFGCGVRRGVPGGVASIRAAPGPPRVGRIALAALGDIGLRRLPVSPSHRGARR
jgi:hypothetical protein